MRNVFAFSLCLFVLLSPLRAQPPTQTWTVPRRVEFKAPLRSDLILAKLWYDIGLFHPFTGEVSRDQWEKGFFELLNRAVRPNPDYPELIAEAVALLKDPYSLLLEAGEGQGANFLPAVWEIRNNEIWLIGTLETYTPQPFGPITTINDIPLSVFLKSRLGSYQTSERVISALSLLGVRDRPFSIKLGNGAKSLLLESMTPQGSIKGLAGMMVDGSPWKGSIQYQMRIPDPHKSPFDYNQISTLDLRDSNWSINLEHGISENMLNLRGALAPSMSVVRLSREHRGQWDADWDRFAHDSYNYNRVVAIASPNSIPYLNDRKPCKVFLPPILLNETIAEAIAGWALPASMHVAARSTTYQLTPTMSIRLRLDSWGTSLSQAKNAATYNNGAILNGEAAKLLAAAAVINFDHYFGFTPERLQQELVTKTISTLDSASDVMDFIQRIGGATKDPHGPAMTYQGYVHSPIQDLIQDLLPPKELPIAQYPSLEAIRMKDGKFRLTRSIKNGPKAGAEIVSIDGISFRTAISKIEPYSAARSDHRDYIPHRDLMVGRTFGEPSYSSDFSSGYPTRSVEMQVINFSTSLPQVFSVPSSNLGDDGMVIATPSTKPNSLIVCTPETPTTFEAITKYLETGRTVLIDMTKSGDSITFPWYGRSPWLLPAPYVSPQIWEHHRTPSFPFSWGSIEPTQSLQLRWAFPSLSTRGVPSVTSTETNNHVSGTLIFLVCSKTVSIAECQITFLKTAFPNNSILIGLPTGGITGSLTKLYLPSGKQDNRLVLYSPTSSMTLINGVNHDYNSLPLDYYFSDKDLIREFNTGSDDVLLTAAIYYSNHQFPKLNKFRPQTGSTKSPNRLSSK